MVGGVEGGHPHQLHHTQRGGSAHVHTISCLLEAMEECDVSNHEVLKEGEAENEMCRRAAGANVPLSDPRARLGRPPNTPAIPHYTSNHFWKRYALGTALHPFTSISVTPVFTQAHIRNFATLKSGVLGASACRPSEAAHEAISCRSRCMQTPSLPIFVVVTMQIPTCVIALTLRTPTRQYPEGFRYIFCLPSSQHTAKQILNVSDPSDSTKRSFIRLNSRPRECIPTDTTNPFQSALRDEL